MAEQLEMQSLAGLASKTGAESRRKANEVSARDGRAARGNSNDSASRRSDFDGMLKSFLGNEKKSGPAAGHQKNDATATTNRNRSGREQPGNKHEDAATSGDGAGSAAMRMAPKDKQALRRAIEKTVPAERRHEPAGIEDKQEPARSGEYYADNHIPDDAAYSDDAAYADVPPPLEIDSETAAAAAEAAKLIWNILYPDPQADAAVSAAAETGSADGAALARLVEKLTQAGETGNADGAALAGMSTGHLGTEAVAGAMDTANASAEMNIDAVLAALDELLDGMPREALEDALAKLAGDMGVSRGKTGTLDEIAAALGVEVIAAEGHENARNSGQMLAELGKSTTVIPEPANAAAPEAPADTPAVDALIVPVEADSEIVAADASGTAEAEIPMTIDGKQHRPAVPEDKNAVSMPVEAKPEPVATVPGTPPEETIEKQEASASKGNDVHVTVVPSDGNAACKQAEAEQKPASGVSGIPPEEMAAEPEISVSADSVSIEADVQDQNQVIAKDENAVAEPAETRQAPVAAAPEVIPENMNVEPKKAVAEAETVAAKSSEFVPDDTKSNAATENKAVADKSAETAETGDAAVNPVKLSGRQKDIAPAEISGAKTPETEIYDLFKQFLKEKTAENTEEGPITTTASALPEDAGGLVEAFAAWVSKTHNSKEIKELASNEARLGQILTVAMVEEESKAARSSGITSAENFSEAGENLEDLLQFISNRNTAKTPEALVKPESGFVLPGKGFGQPQMGETAGNAGGQSGQGAVFPSLPTTGNAAPAATQQPAGGASSMLDQLQNIERLAEAMKMANRGPVKSLSLQLSPPELGKVTLRVESRDGVVSAFLKVEKPEAASQLSGNLQQLRENLKAQGIELGELEIRQQPQGQTAGYGENRQRRNRGADDDSRNSGHNGGKAEAATEIEAAEKTPRGTGGKGKLNLFA